MVCAVNMRSLSWVAEALAGIEGLVIDAQLPGGAGKIWTGAAVDSRAACSGRLFFALSGEHTDGHRYVQEAFQSGCVAVVVENKDVCVSLAKNGVPFVLVTDVLKSLQELARIYRRHIDVRAIAITGSTGKTTTKEYTRQIMKSKFRAFASPGNFNSLIGVPLTILETESDNEYLICEIGANQMGEIDFLSKMLAPEIGVITNIGDAHVGMFGSVENIVLAKGELLDHIDSTGYAILPQDSPFLEKLRERTGAKALTFGETAGSDFTVSDFRPAEEGLRFKVNDEEISLCSYGRYNAFNACASFAVGELCGVDPASIRKALQKVVPMPGRGRIHRFRGVKMIDESYNASPASMRESLKMLAGLDAGRRLAVLGDMKELGKYSKSKHRDLGEFMARFPVDRIFWLGQEGKTVREGYIKGGGTAAFNTFDAIGDLVKNVSRFLKAGDVVVVKASRMCLLDQFVSGILAAQNSSMEN